MCRSINVGFFNGRMTCCIVVYLFILLTLKVISILDVRHENEHEFFT